MELSNEFIEDLFLQQIKELTIRTNKQLKSFDAQFSGWSEVIQMKGLFDDEPEEKTEEDFYNNKYLEEYVENDEINAVEEGFMMGYLE